MKSAACCLFWISVLGAQQPMDHSQMNHGQMKGMHGNEMSDAEMLLMNQASGTSLNPEGWPMPMWMGQLKGWHSMLMANAFLVETQQSGPRGGDKFYSPNWLMAAAQRSMGKGTFMVRLMLSLDPATMTHRRYPLLFQTGETAFGRPIIDGQHPHDFLMGLSFHYARPIGEKTTVQAYFAPVGDPALGPVAFPHRASAMELPQAPLGHHWQDSTHIANEVVTVGIKHRFLQFEASGFYGAEPNENRWNIDSGPMDSWSARFSVLPSKNWIAQVSTGRLTNPEKLEPGDVWRTTASVEYTRPMGTADSWSTSAIWGRNHNTLTKHDSNAWLVESVAPVGRRNFVTGRFEVVDKDELLEHHEATRIVAYTAGYTRDFALFPKLQTGIGMNFSAYSIARELKPVYGEHPVGFNIYLRIRVRPATH